MPVTARWHPDVPHVIWIRITDPWARTDLYQAWGHIKELAMSVDENVHTVTDFSEIQTWPENLLFTHISNMLQDAPPNRKLAIVIAQQRFIQMGKEFIERLQSKPLESVTIVTNLEDGLDIIRQYQAKHSRTD